MQWVVVADEEVSTVHSGEVVGYLGHTCPLEAWELVTVTYLVVSTPTIHTELLRVKKHIDSTILIERITLTLGTITQAITSTVCTCEHKRLRHSRRVEHTVAVTASVILVVTLNLLLEEDDRVM